MATAWLPYRADERGHLSVNYGTIYPALSSWAGGLHRSAWGASENNRKAKFYRLTRAGHRQLERKRASGAHDRHHRQAFMPGGSSS